MMKEEGKQKESSWNEMRKKKNKEAIGEQSRKKQIWNAGIGMEEGGKNKRGQTEK